MARPWLLCTLEGNVRGLLLRQTSVQRSASCLSLVRGPLPSSSTSSTVALWQERTPETDSDENRSASSSAAATSATAGRPDRGLTPSAAELEDREKLPPSGTPTTGEGERETTSLYSAGFNAFETSVRLDRLSRGNGGLMLEPATESDECRLPR